MSTTTIRQVLGGRPALGVTADTPVAEVARMMAGNSVGAVVVLDTGRLAGILTERDIVFRAVAAGLPVEQTTASQIMTPDPVTLHVDDAISDALAAKLGDVFRHLPVIENDAVVGILSYRDIPAEYVMLFERFREMSSARADDGV